MQPVKASPLSDDAFRLLAYPFTGPIPYPAAPRGADVDTQWFTERTDIKGDWLPARPVDWHHRGDPLMGGAVLGKAVDLGPFGGPGKEPDEDGWWVTVWLAHGDRRTDLVRRLAERATLYGSSETVQGLGRVRTAKGDVVAWRPDIPGEITSWPYWRQALSTSPQNTHSIIRPLKAALDDLASLGVQPSGAFWSGIEDALRSLGHDLRATSDTGSLNGGKAGRVLRRSNEAELRAALAAFQEAAAKVEAVLSTQTQDRAEEADEE